MVLSICLSIQVSWVTMEAHRKLNFDRNIPICVFVTDSIHYNIYHWATWAMQPPPPLTCEKSRRYLPLYHSPHDQVNDLSVHWSLSRTIFGLLWLMNDKRNGLQGSAVRTPRPVTQTLRKTTMPLLTNLGNRIVGYSFVSRPRAIKWNAFGSGAS